MLQEFLCRIGLHPWVTIRYYEDYFLVSKPGADCWSEDDRTCGFCGKEEYPKETNEHQDAIEGR